MSKHPIEWERGKEKDRDREKGKELAMLNWWISNWWNKCRGDNFECREQQNKKLLLSRTAGLCSPSVWPELHSQPTSAQCAKIYKVQCLQWRWEVSLHGSHRRGSYSQTSISFFHSLRRYVFVNALSIQRDHNFTFWVLIVFENQSYTFSDDLISSDIWVTVTVNHLLSM